MVTRAQARAQQGQAACPIPAQSPESSPAQQTCVDRSPTRLEPTIPIPSTPPTQEDVDEYGNLRCPTKLCKPLLIPAMPSSASPSVSMPSPQLSGPATPAIPKPLPREVFKVNWAEHYQQCHRWTDTWRQVLAAQKNEVPWPTGYRLCDERLLKDGMWCVPTALTGAVLRAQHEVSGHIGGERLWKEACRHFQFANPKEAYGLAVKMIKICEVCQACEHPHQPLKLTISPTPVPSHIMSSVSIDLFVMPEVEYEGQQWNVFAACVDRHSGWMVVTPHHTKGLTAEKVAKAMYNKWWSPHGIPSVLTSDRGPHFAGAWWRTMCALHGVRHAYSQAHHKPGNGRAEVAGAQLQVRLRKMQASDGICWMESLPRAVQQLHDVPGQSGLSPYEILYGRHRPYAGVPYSPPKQLEDAVAFFERQRLVDTKVAKTLNVLHAKRADQVNAQRRELKPLPVGSLVWYLRPRGRPGEKLETYWLGPSKVLQRVSDHSYVIELEPNRHQHAHRSQLKEHHEDPIGPPVKLFQYRQAREDVEAGPHDWIVQKITGHRRGPNGDPLFEVLWEGSKQPTWEPLRNFFHRYNQMVIDYCRDNRINVDLMDYLRRNPPDDEDAVVAHVMAEKVAETGVSWEEPPLEWTWTDSEPDAEPVLPLRE